MWQSCLGAAWLLAQGMPPLKQQASAGRPESRSWKRNRLEGGEDGEKRIQTPEPCREWLWVRTFLLIKGLEVKWRSYGDIYIYPHL